MHKEIESLVEQMTLEEKAGLCSGLDFWHTKAVERLGIPSLMLTDGPHGLRKQLGGAVADLLFGDVNPSGKLAETFPVMLEHNPSWLNFPGESDRVEYREGLFVGYRYYDAKKIEPLFPFGFGLSYTTFDYTAIELDKREVEDTETVQVCVSVKKNGRSDR